MKHRQCIVNTLAGMIVFWAGNELWAQPATVLAPAGGEMIEKGSTYTIRWEQLDTTVQMIVKLSTDGGENQTPISQRIPLGQMTYTWEVPEDLPTSTECIIYVCIYYSQGFYGETARFSVVEKGSSVKKAPAHARLRPSGSGTGFYTANGRRMVGSSIGARREGIAFPGMVIPHSKEDNTAGFGDSPRSRNQ